VNLSPAVQSNRGAIMTIFLRNPREKLILCLTVSLLSLAQTNLSAFSDTALNPEEASLDTAVATSVPAETSHNSPLLNGSIHKTDINLPTTTDSNSEKPGAAMDAKATSTGETSAHAGEKSNTYKLAVEKLGTGVKLTAEDYRNLNVGIVGMEAVRTFYTSKYKVIRIVKGSPADLVGIKIGDTYKKDDSFDDSKVKDPTVPAYMFSCGLAGEEQDYTMQRHGKTLQFHIVKMNMEDLPELKDRHQLEHLVSQTGFPANAVTVSGYGANDSAQEEPRVQSHSIGFSILKTLVGF
jgi:hypothetical protein